jgi:hypothetical protein
MVRSVSVTRSSGSTCKNAEVGLMAFGTSTAPSASPVVASFIVRVKNPMLFCPTIGKSISTTRWLVSFLAIMVSNNWRTEV